MRIFEFWYGVMLAVFFLSSCKEEKREISPEKIYGRWELQNDVKFTTDLAFSLMS